MSIHRVLGLGAITTNAAWCIWSHSKKGNIVVAQAKFSCYFGTSGQRRCFRNEYLEGVYFLYLDALGKP
jgi:hypothetical protein